MDIVFCCKVDGIGESNYYNNVLLFDRLFFLMTHSFTLTSDYIELNKLLKIHGVGDS